MLCWPFSRSRRPTPPGRGRDSEGLACRPNPDRRPIYCPSFRGSSLKLRRRLISEIRRSGKATRRPFLLLERRYLKVAISVPPEQKARRGAGPSSTSAGAELARTTAKSDGRKISDQIGKDRRSCEQAPRDGKPASQPTSQIALGRLLVGSAHISLALGASLGGHSSPLSSSNSSSSAF